MSLGILDYETSDQSELSLSLGILCHEFSDQSELSLSQNDLSLSIGILDYESCLSDLSLRLGKLSESFVIESRKTVSEGEGSTYHNIEITGSTEVGPPPLSRTVLKSVCKKKPGVVGTLRIDEVGV